MRILFVRHAEAVDGAEFDGPDLKRPLTRGGWKSARRAFRRLPVVAPVLDIILHSSARRARETARALKESYPRARLREEDGLNPGATPTDVRRALAKHGGGTAHVAIVGHEPDLSATIEALTGGRCRLKKGAVAVVEPGPRARLAALLEPDHLAAMKKPLG